MVADRLFAAGAAVFGDPVDRRTVSSLAKSAVGSRKFTSSSGGRAPEIDWDVGVLSVADAGTRASAPDGGVMLEWMGATPLEGVASVVSRSSFGRTVRTVSPPT